MLSSILLGLCGAAAVAAAPHPFADYVRDGKIMVLDEHGQDQLIDLDNYLETLKANNISLETPEIDHDWLKLDLDVSVDVDVTAVGGLEKRQCGDTTYITIDKNMEQNFVDWDVQMSPVACAGASNMQITVTNGFSVGNSMSIEGGISPTLIKNKLEASVGVDFTRTYTSSTLIANQGTVRAGFCGLMITKPLTRRRYGTIWQGCIGSSRKIGSFVADDRGTANYNGVQWISGAISICEKQQSQPPLTRCAGEGKFQ